MSPADTAQPSSAPSTDEVMVRSVTVIAGVVVALTFIFGFGNVWTLAVRLGVPAWVAPLVAPAVDLSILGLLLGTRHLALHGATPEELRPARRLLIFSNIVTLALNVADPLIAGALGKAAFDSVGPLLLIGWAEVGPGFLQAISRTNTDAGTLDTSEDSKPVNNTIRATGEQDRATCESESGKPTRTWSVHDRRGTPEVDMPNDLLERARQEDVAHRAIHQRPISADTLRRRLGIGAKRSRQLVALVRSPAQAHLDGDSSGSGAAARDSSDAAAWAA